VLGFKSVWVWLRLVVKVLNRSDRVAFWCVVQLCEYSICKGCIGNQWVLSKGCVWDWVGLSGLE